LGITKTRIILRKSYPRTGQWPRKDSSYRHTTRSEKARRSDKSSPTSPVKSSTFECRTKRTSSKRKTAPNEKNAGDHILGLEHGARKGSHERTGERETLIICAERTYDHNGFQGKSSSWIEKKKKKPSEKTGSQKLIEGRGQF